MRARRPLVKLGPLRIFASDSHSDIQVRRRQESLGCNGLCPFCHYIGPPLLCGCVTKMFHALQAADKDASLLDPTTADHQVAIAIAEHVERIRILNQELQRQRDEDRA